MPSRQKGPRPDGDIGHGDRQRDQRQRPAPRQEGQGPIDRRPPRDRKDHKERQQTDEPHRRAMNHHGADRRGVADGKTINEPSPRVFRLEAAESRRRPKRVAFRRRGGDAATRGGRLRRTTQWPEKPLAPGCLPRRRTFAVRQMLRQLVTRRKPHAPVPPEHRGVRPGKRRLQAADRPQPSAAGGKIDRDAGMLLVGRKVDQDRLRVFRILADRGGKSVDPDALNLLARSSAGKDEANGRSRRSSASDRRPHVRRRRPGHSATAAPLARPKPAARTSPPSSIPTAAPQAPARRQQPDRIGRPRTVWH